MYNSLVTAYLILQPAGSWPPVARVGEGARPVLEAGPGLRLERGEAAETLEAAPADFLGLGAAAFLAAGDAFGGATFLAWLAP